MVITDHGHAGFRGNAIAINSPVLHPNIFLMSCRDHHDIVSNSLNTEGMDSLALPAIYLENPYTLN